MERAAPVRQASATNAETGLPGTIAVVLLALLLAWFAIDDQSFWMDEFGTWKFARAASLADWLHGFLQTDSSDGQIPLYHFLLFLWSRIVGLHEVALRSLNVLFLVPMVLCIVRSGALTSAERWLWIALLLSHCFLWAYLNEARPYAMMIFGASLLTLSCVSATQAKTNDALREVDTTVRLYAFGTLICFGASPASSPFIGGVGLINVILLGWRRPAIIGEALKRNAPVVVFCVIATLVCVTVVVHSMATGAAPDRGHTTSLASVAFGLSETIGAAGFLPGREQLRQGGMTAVQSWQWALLIIDAACVFGLAARALIAGRRRHIACALALVGAISVVGVALVGRHIGFRVVGRHMSFIVPVFTLLVAFGLLSLERAIRAIAIAFMLTLQIASSLLFHFEDDQKKEDYKTVIGLVQDEMRDGGTVWWNGERFALLYHKLEPTPLADIRAGSRQAAGAVIIAPAEDWRDMRTPPPKPKLIVVQRPETNDRDAFFEHAARQAALTKSADYHGLIVYSAPTP